MQLRYVEEPDGILYNNLLANNYKFPIMKTLKLLSVIAITLLFAGCKSDDNADSMLENVKAVKTPKELVKAYVDNNTYIDIDIPSVAYGIANPSSSSVKIGEDDVAKAKAAIYRFYKNVSVADGYFICSIQSGSDINVSDNVFTALSDNLNEMNSFIRKAKAKGETVNIFEPDENYLNSLLE